MLAMPEAQIELKTTHYFAQGMYAREIFIPKGTVLTGKIHKTEHISVVSQGEIMVWTDEGMKRVKAPYTVVAKPGMKRVGLALEDTVWITFHTNENNETDLVKLEDKLIAKTFAELEFIQPLEIEEKK